jgi:uncharacterized protein (TIGR02246 family)
MVKSPAEVAEVVQRLTRAWNSGDSTAFAGEFAEDGDIVNIYGMRLRGRATIAGVYDMLFRSVFKRSRIAAEVNSSRNLCNEAFMLQLRIAVHVPSGNMAGDHDAVCSMVLQREGRSWRVGSLHNTLVNEGLERSLVA